MHVESPKYLLTKMVYCKNSLQLEEIKKEKQVAHYLEVCYCSKSHKKKNVNPLFFTTKQYM